MGAVGILRCAAYASQKNTALVGYKEGDLDPCCSLQHYYDKLLRLQDLLKTEKGRSLGTARHLFMQKFLQQVEVEVDLDGE